MNVCVGGVNEGEMSEGDDGIMPSRYKKMYTSIQEIERSRGCWSVKCVLELVSMCVDKYRVEHGAVGGPCVRLHQRACTLRCQFLTQTFQRTVIGDT